MTRSFPYSCCGARNRTGVWRFCYFPCFHTSMDYPIFLNSSSEELSIIVSEPSVRFRGGLGCRLPNLHFFEAFTLILSDHVVASEALTVFQQFRRFSISHYCDRSQLPMSLPRYLSSTPLFNNIKLPTGLYHDINHCSIRL